VRYLFSQAAAAELGQLAAERTLCAFDFDGTLAPIVERPEDAQMRDRTRSLLTQVAAVYPCVIVSGRARADVLKRMAGVPVEGVFGNHGAESSGRSAAALLRVEEWRASLEPEISALTGAWIEDKGLSLAVHYRQCPDKTAARKRILTAVRKLQGVRIIPGKQVVNVLMTDAPHKGQAVASERKRLNCKCVLFVGDDENDEDAFAMDARIVSVRVGRKRDSSARYYLKSQAEIDKLLETLVTQYDRARHREVA